MSTLTSDASDGGPYENTDRHLWPDTSDPRAEHESIHVTKDGGIGINVGGYVYVKPLREWHKLAGGKEAMQPKPEPLTSNDRLSQIREHDFPILLEFHSKHALPPLMRPSCLVCGRVPGEWPPAIQHAELPAIVVCHLCRDRATPETSGDQVKTPEQLLQAARDALDAAGPFIVRNLAQAVVEIIPRHYEMCDSRLIRAAQKWRASITVNGPRSEAVAELCAAVDALSRAAEETGAVPLVDELLANPPSGAEERLANAINTSNRLETLSNQALVDIALDGCFTDTSTTSTLVLHEMCSRLHPGWEKEDPEEDGRAQKAAVGPFYDVAIDHTDYCHEHGGHLVGSPACELARERAAQNGNPQP